jgi:hypothetical protein
MNLQATMQTAVPEPVQAKMSRYNIAFKTRNISGEWFWVKSHESLEEIAKKAQEYCVEVWCIPPLGPKLINYQSNHDATPGDSKISPVYMAETILSYKDIIESGYKLTINIESSTFMGQSIRTLHVLEIYKPDAVNAKEEAERAERRATGRVHHCGDEFCPGDCEELCCGCMYVCWCKNGKGLRRFIERGY